MKKTLNNLNNSNNIFIDSKHFYVNSNGLAKLNTVNGKVSVGSTKLYTFVEIKAENYDTAYKIVNANLRLKLNKINGVDEVVEVYKTTLNNISDDNALKSYIIDLNNSNLINKVTVPDIGISDTSNRLIDQSEYVDVSQLFKNINQPNFTVVLLLVGNNNNHTTYTMYDPFIMNDDGEKVFEIDVVKVSGLNKSYSFDKYGNDENGNAYVNRYNGDLTYVYDLFSSHSKKVPIKLSLIINKENIPGTLIKYKTKLSYQADLEIKKENNDVMSLYLYDASRSIKEYILVNNVLNYKFIKNHEGDIGDVLVCNEDNTYIYYSENNNVSYLRLYDKYDNLIEYEYSFNILKIKKMTTYLGHFITYTWQGNIMSKIENSDNEIVYLSQYGDNLSFIEDTSNNVFYNFTYLTNKINIEVTRYHEEDSGDENTLYNVEFLFNTDEKLTQVYNSKTERLINFNYDSLNRISHVSQRYDWVSYVVYNSYEYFESYTKVTYTNKEYVYYYFDEYGRLTYEENSDGDIYKNKYLNNNKVTASAFVPQNKTQSKNSDFKKLTNTIPNDWFVAKKNTTSISRTTLSNFNNLEFLRIKMDSNDTVKISQIIGLVPSGKYGSILSCLKDSNVSCSIIVKDYQSQNLLYDADSLNSLNSYEEYLMENTSLVNYNHVDYISDTMRDLLVTELDLSSDKYHYLVVEIIVSCETSGSAYLSFYNLLSEKFFNERNLLGLTNIDYLLDIETSDEYNELVAETNNNQWFVYGNSLSVVDYTGESLIFDKYVGSRLLKLNKNSETFNNKYQAEIDVKKDELVSFACFGKCWTTSNAPVLVVLSMKYVQNNNEYYDDYYFTLESHNDKWQAITESFIAKHNYILARISLYNYSCNDAYFDCFQLYKKGLVNYYDYDDNGNLLSCMDKNNIQTQIVYNNENKISHYSSSDGISYRYFYDEKGRISELKDHLNNSISFTYDEEDNIINQSITYNGQTISTSNTYDSCGDVLSTTDEYGKQTIFTKDDVGRIITEALPNSSLINYQYNDLNQLVNINSTINNILNSNTLTYTSKNKINNIKTNNGGTYSFIYDPRGFITSIKYNDIVICTLEHEHDIDGANLGLLTNMENEYNDIYDYTYDDKERLKYIYENGTKVIRFEYDERNNISLIANYKNEEIKHFTYDDNNRIIKVLDEANNNKNYFYDNLGNVQKVNYKIEDKVSSIDYGYTYENNDFTRNGYFSRLTKLYKDELVIAGRDFNGIYGLKEIGKNIEVSSGDVPTFDFTLDNQYLKFDLKTLNENLKLTNKYPDGSAYNDLIFRNSFNYTKTFYVWAKLTGQYSWQQLMLFKNNFNGVEQYLGTLDIKEDGYVKYYSYGSTTASCTSSSKVNLNAWNLIGVTFSKATVNSSSTCRIFVNNSYTSEVTISENSYLINELLLGDNLTTENALLLKYNVACLGIGHNLFTSKLNKIYNEGLKYIDVSSGEQMERSHYYNKEVYDGYEVYPLNGTIESNLGNEPTVIVNNEISSNFNKSKLFYYNENDKRNIFGSFNTENLLNNDSTNLYINEGQMINKLLSLRFKLSNYTSSLRRFIYSTPSLGIYYQYDKLHFIVGNTITDLCNVTFNEWNNLVVYYKHYSINNVMILIYINDEYQTSINTQLLNAICPIFLGKQLNISGTELNGYIDMVAIKSCILTDSELAQEVNKLYLYGNPISNVNTYNELGQLTKKEIKTNNTTLTNSYTYTKTRLYQETILGTPFRYQYDNMGNVTNILTRLNATTFRSKIGYTYDGLGRLIKENDLTYTTTYTYDSNGNIQTIKKTRKLLQAQVVFEKKFNYNETYKDRLESIEYIQGTGETISLSYDEKKLYPKSIWYSTLTSPYEIEYENGRIKSYRGNTFTYNSDGVRIKKENILKTHEYTVDGNKIIKEKITASNGVYELFYNHDQYGELLSVELNGNIYFYIKDALGIIQKLVDENGNIVVSYTYDGWGKVTINNSSITDIGTYNPFMYKDYYYDKELGMYNINNRFYLPDINRFLIPDSVGNIDIKDIGNLNLYTYSNNNPINGCYKDKLDESKPSNSTVNTITPSRTVLAPKFKTWSNIGGGLSVFLNVAGNVVDGIDMYSGGIGEAYDITLLNNTSKVLGNIGYGITVGTNIIDWINSVGSNMYNPYYSSGEKVLAYFSDSYYYGFKSAVTVASSIFIGEASASFVGLIVGAGLSLGVTVIGVVAVITVALLISYGASKGLEWLDEKYSNAKKEWFE